MKVWWKMACDNNHRWEVYIEDSPEPSQYALTCPEDGTPAVTAKRMPPADRVRVTLVPAARIADHVTGAVVDDSKYFVEIQPSGQVTGETLRSQRPYDWDEAVRKASVFNKASWEDAQRRWLRTGLGRASP